MARCRGRVMAATLPNSCGLFQASLTSSAHLVRLVGPHLPPVASPNVDP